MTSTSSQFLFVWFLRRLVNSGIFQVSVFMKDSALNKLWSVKSMIGQDLRRYLLSRFYSEQGCSSVYSRGGSSLPRACSGQFLGLREPPIFWPVVHFCSILLIDLSHITESLGNSVCLWIKICICVCWCLICFFGRWEQFRQRCSLCSTCLLRSHSLCYPEWLRVVGKNDWNTWSIESLHVFW